MRMARTDQPGRWCAVCVFSPWLLQRGVEHGDRSIAGFAVLLFVWDLYWLVCKTPSSSQPSAAAATPAAARPHLEGIPGIPGIPRPVWHWIKVARSMWSRGDNDKHPSQ